MAGGNANAYLPDGTQAFLPIKPITWIDPSGAQRGDSLRAPLLQFDSGGTVVWHRQRPLYQGAAFTVQSIPSSTWTAIVGHTELIDNYAGHSDATNTGRYYVPFTSSNTNGQPGDWYLCTGYVPFSSNDTTHVHIAGLRITGSATIIEGGKIPGGAGHVIDTMVVDLVQASALGSGDYIELMAWQNTGAAVNTLGSGKSPSLTTRWVAADHNWSDFFTPALPSAPHTWTNTDTWTASATGAGKVPLNTELRDLARFLNNPPLARLTSETSVQTIPTGAGTWTSVTFPTETVDTYAGHSTVSNTSRYVAQRAGLYLVAGFVSVAEPAAKVGYRAARLLQTFAAGGTQAYAGWACLPMTSTTTTGTGIYATGLIRMAAGDYIETQMSHTQGAALTVNASAGGCCRMIAVWMAL